MNRLAEQIIADILMNRMSLDQSAVWLRQQNVKIPDDKTLFIQVGMVDTPRVIGNITRMEQVTDDTVDPPVITQHEINEVQVQESIQIDIMSRNNEALFRFWEVIAAMQSFYSQQQQELNNFKIFRQPISVVNTSGAEGGSNINRYSITIAAFIWYRKDTTLNSPLGDYYDDFTQRADDDKTIGTETPLFEFEINEDTPPPP